MWLNLLSMAVKTGASVYKNRQDSKRLRSEAERLHYERMANGEVEYQARVIESSVGATGGAYAVSSFLKVSISRLPSIAAAIVFILCAALSPTDCAPKIFPSLFAKTLIEIGLPPGK